MAWREKAEISKLNVDELIIRGLIKGGINTGGKVWYVHNTYGSNGGGKNGKSWDTPFASMEYATGKCRASRGDVVVALPGHTETIATDGGLAMDVDGVYYVGFGYGDSRPLIQVATLAAAAAIMSGDGCLLDNFRLSVAIDAATDPFQITGTGNIWRNLEVIEASACEAIDLISIAAAADRNILHDIKIRGRNTGDGDAHCAIHLNGCDDCEIYNIHAYNGDWEEGVIKNEGDECLNVHIHHCILQTQAAEDLAIILDSAATGEIHDLKCILKDDAANIDECLSIGDCHAFDPILVVNADSEKGIEWPGTDSADSA